MPQFPRLAATCVSPGFRVNMGHEDEFDTIFMIDSNKPLAGLEEWEDFLKERYPEPQQAATAAKPYRATDSAKQKEQFRNYEADARPTVREFYRQNHTHQTYDFVQAKRKDFLGLSRRQMNVWEA